MELYPAAYIASRKRNKTIWLVIACGLAVLSLAVCITLCVLTTTATEDRYEFIVLLVSGLSGCVVIFLWKNLVFENVRELRHIHSVQEDAPTTVEGKITVLPDRFRIPGSVYVQRLQVDGTDHNTATVSVNSRRVKLLSGKTQSVRLYTVHGYVVAFEELP